jgi:hypothetical protein
MGSAKGAVEKKLMEMEIAYGDCDDLPMVPLAGEMVEIYNLTTFRWSFSRMDKNNYNYNYIRK